MAVTFVALGGAAGGTTTATPTVPVGHAVGDLLLLLVGNKPTNTPIVTGVTYGKVGEADIGTGIANGLDVGDARMSIWSRVATSTAETAPTATVTSGSPTRVQMHCYRCAAGNQWSLKGGGGPDAVSDTSIAITVSGFANGDFAAGDWIVIGIMIPGNNMVVSGSGVTIPGCTVAAPSTTANGANTGNRGYLAHMRAQITAGSSTGQPSVTGTTSAAQTEVAYVVRVREFPILATTGTLPATVGLTATSKLVRTTTATLPATIGLTATTAPAGIRATTGTLPVTAGLTAVVRAVRVITATLPVTVGLSATTRLPPPPGAPVEIKHLLRTLSGAPAVRVHIRARLLTPAYQTDDTELIPPAETYTDATGMFRFYLPPSSTLTPTGVYEITWAGAKRTVTVPDAGPVLLGDIAVPGIVTPSTVLTPG